MTDPLSDFTGHTRREQEAADWIARNYEGLDANGKAEFELWLASDGRNAEIYAELEETWKLLDRARDEPVARAASRAQALRGERRLFYWLASALSAAAVVALAYFTLFQQSPDPLEFSEVAVTDAGKFRTLTLPDGSVARLNSNTRIEVQYGSQARRVRLMQGEAFFTVMKNANRPFHVEAKEVAVRAVGTAFNVRLHAAAVEVLVTEGKVRVHDLAHGQTLISPRASAEPAMLGAGEWAVIPESLAREKNRLPVAILSIAEKEMERALAWRERRLEFVAVPLKEIVAEFNRYNQDQIVIDDEALGARRFGGSFRADEPATFVRLLQTRFDLSVEVNETRTVLRSGRPKK